MHNIERITNESLSDVLIDMKERHTEMLKWSKEGQNNIGGIFGAAQNAMGETEVDTEKLTPMLERLIAHGDVFYSTHPSCSHTEGRKEYGDVARHSYKVYSRNWFLR